MATYNPSPQERAVYEPLLQSLNNLFMDVMVSNNWSQIDLLHQRLKDASEHINIRREVIWDIPWYAKLAYKDPPPPGTYLYSLVELFIETLLSMLGGKNERDVVPRIEKAIELGVKPSYDFHIASLEREIQQIISPLQRQIETRAGWRRKAAMVQLNRNEFGSHAIKAYYNPRNEPLMKRLYGDMIQDVARKRSKVGGRRKGKSKSKSRTKSRKAIRSFRRHRN